MVLVSAEWLLKVLDDPAVKVFDASWFMPSANRNAQAEYAEAHIPGAQFFDIDAISELDRQAQMLNMIHEYDGQCRAASEKGGDLNELFTLPVREGIGRAKSVPADEYKDNYAALLDEMERLLPELDTDTGPQPNMATITQLPARAE